MWSRRAFLRTTGMLGPATLALKTPGLEAITLATDAHAHAHASADSGDGDGDS